MRDLEPIRSHMTQALDLPVRAVERLGVTAYNRHYRVELDEGRLHLVVYTLPEALPLQGIHFEHALVRHLRAAGFEAVPELVVRGGESLFAVGRWHYALTEWIEGCHSEADLVVTSDQVIDSARTLAALHRATIGFERSLDYFAEHVFVYPVGAVLAARGRLLDALTARLEADADGRFGDEARAQHARIAPALAAFFESFDGDAYGRVRAGDATSVVHGDYRRINLVYGGDGRVRRVLDYNCCFNEVRLWDVAYAALSFGGRETVGPLTDSARAADFIRAYDAASSLTAEEWALLPSFLVLVVAKLLLAAVEGWWITDRAATFERLLEGEARRVVARAREGR